MPDLFLESLVDGEGKQTDPAADITAFLLSSRQSWQPAATALKANSQDLDSLAFELLSKAFYQVDARQYLESGVPDSLAAGLKGAEIELVGSSGSPEGLELKKLLYIGRKSIAKYGCYACHDVPGFEDAKPIGTALTDWGRKDPARLAFEHILEYTGDGHEHGDSSSPRSEEASQSDDESFYMERLAGHDRVGFIWQKLKEPRSFDYKNTRNREYAERLRMPWFAFDSGQREAVVTFVLGLVSEPPAHEFVYHPDERDAALIAGREVLDRFNCAGCHVLEPGRWEIQYRPDDFAPQQLPPIYPFVKAQFTSEQLAASAKSHPLRGTLRATLEGVAAISNETAAPMVLDEEGFPLEEGETYNPSTLQHLFDLWRPVALNGHPYQVGPQPLTIKASMITGQTPPVGGDLTLRLLPRVLEIEKQTNPQAKGREAWGWLPPPLVDQGKKVQPAWLHGFLLDPHMIRPAVFLRMPKFNMSSAEATSLVNYFAARDTADYPYEFLDRARSQHLRELEMAYERRAGTAATSAATSPGMLRLDAAMNIVASSDYCVQCHIVADFVPKGSDRAKAPDLAEAYRRLRGEYVRNWIANPPGILPYTGMPLNIPYNPDAEHLGGVKQELFHGTSIEQLDGVVDLLMNFDRFMAGRSAIAPLVKPATAPPAAQASANEQ
jgi:hypothetical protein